MDSEDGRQFFLGEAGGDFEFPLRENLDTAVRTDPKLALIVFCKRRNEAGEAILLCQRSNDLPIVDPRKACGPTSYPHIAHARGKHGIDVITGQALNGGDRVDGLPLNSEESLIL